MRRGRQSHAQLAPDLLLLVADGPFGPGPHAIEVERHAVGRHALAAKLNPYRRAAAVRRGMPALFVCETQRAADRVAETAGSLPLLATTLDAARLGPLTGERAIWSGPGQPVTLRCQG